MTNLEMIFGNQAKPAIEQDLTPIRSCGTCSFEGFSDVGCPSEQCHDCDSHLSNWTPKDNSREIVQMADDGQSTLPIVAKMKKPEGIDNHGTSVKSPEPYFSPVQKAKEVEPAKPIKQEDEGTTIFNSSKGGMDVENHTPCLIETSVLIGVKYQIETYTMRGKGVIAIPIITEIEGVPMDRIGSLVSKILEKLWDDTDLSDRIEWAKEMGEEEPITEQWDRDDNWIESPEMGAE